MVRFEISGEEGSGSGAKWNIPTALPKKWCLRCSRPSSVGILVGRSARCRRDVASRAVGRDVETRRATPTAATRGLWTQTPGFQTASVVIFYLERQREPDDLSRTGELQPCAGEYLLLSSLLYRSKGWPFSSPPPGFRHPQQKSIHVLVGTLH